MQTVNLSTVTKIHLSSQVRVNGLNEDVVTLMTRSIPKVGQKKPILCQLITIGLIEFVRKYIGEKEAIWLEGEWKTNGKIWLIVDGNHRYEAKCRLNKIHPSDIRYSKIDIEIDQADYASNLSRKIKQWGLNRGVGEERCVNDEETTVSLLIEMVQEDYFAPKSVNLIKSPRTVNKVKSKVTQWLETEAKGTALSGKKTKQRIVDKVFDVHLGAATPPVTERRYSAEELRAILKKAFNVKSGEQIATPNGNTLYYIVTHNDAHMKAWAWVSKMAQAFQYGKVSTPPPFKVAFVYAAGGQTDIIKERNSFKQMIKNVNQHAQCNYGGKVVEEFYTVGQILTGKNKETENYLQSVKI